MNESLEPCPAECLHTIDRGGPSLFSRRADLWGVYCQTCQCATEYYPTEAEAVAAWNRRVPAAPSPDAELDALCERLERLEQLYSIGGTTLTRAAAAIRSLRIAREVDVERVADAIEKQMGPVFGSPEYLADPVKLARAEKRRRDGALASARTAVAAMTGEKVDG